MQSDASQPDTSSTSARPFSIAEQLSRIRLRLLDLTLRNKLLNYRERTRTIKIIDELPEQIYKKLVLERDAMQFLPFGQDEPEATENETIVESTPTSGQEISKIEPAIIFEAPLPTQGELEKKHSDNLLQTPLKPTALATRTKRVYAEANQAIEETGINLLYLAIGFLQWIESESSTTVYRAPLVLIPISLERKRTKIEDVFHTTYKVLWSEEDLEYNLSLAEKLKTDFEIILPPIYEDGEEEFDIEKYFEKVRSAVSRKPKWSISREIVLDFFSFSKLRMYLDLDPLRGWLKGKSPANHPLIHDILGGSEGSSDSPSNIGLLSDPYEIDNHPVANNIPLLRDADSAQHSAIVDALEGKNLVIQGPPGTGKSQTITNLIAAFMAEGKSVLFVAEKLAALEVVKKRLDDSGLGAFVSELHSHKVQKKKFLDDLATRMNSLNFSNSQELEVNQQQVHLARQTLNSYVKLLNSKKASLGDTIFNLLWKFESYRVKFDLGQLPDIKLPVDGEQTSAILSALEIAASTVGNTDLKSHPARGYALENITSLNIQDFRKAVSRLRNEIEGTKQAIEAISSAASCEIPRHLSKLKVLVEGSEQLAKEVTISIPNISIASWQDSAVKENLKFFCASLKSYKEAVAALAEILATPPEFEFEDVEKASEYLNKLKAEGFGELPLIFLDDLKTSAEEIAGHLVALPAVMQRITKPLPTVPNTPGQMKQLNTFLDLALRECPLLSNEEVKAISNPTTHEVIATANNRATFLSKDGVVLEQIFHFDTLPSIVVLRELLSVLRQHPNWWQRIFSKTCKDANRQLLSLVKGKMSYQELVKQVAQLLSYLERKDEFLNDKLYHDAFGPLFQGLKTDWSKVGRAIHWINAVYDQRFSSEFVFQLCDKFFETKSLLEPTHNSISDWSMSWEHIRSKLYDRKNRGSEIGNLLKLMEDGESFSHIRKKVEVLITLIIECQSFTSKMGNSSSLTVKSLSEATQHLSIVGRTRSEISVKQNQFQQLLGNLFNGVDSDVNAITAVLNWIEGLNEAGVPAEIVTWILDDPAQRYAETVTKLGALKSKHQELMAMIEEFKFFGSIDPRIVFGVPWQDVTLDHLHGTLPSLESDDQTLIKWSGICRQLTGLRGLGLSSLCGALIDGSLSAAQALDYYLYQMYSSHAHKTFKEHPELENFSRESHENVREKFKRLDKASQDLQVKRIARDLLNKPVPQGISRGRVGELTELALIKNELAKSKRHLPVRKLFDRAGGALLALKPCMMMSPLSVAQFLAPGKFEFDVVIMDEASQLKPADCLGSICRASQIVVVGDPQQLPPTTFFDKMANDDDPKDEESDQTGLVDVESILDLCIRGYGEGRRLLWHYRSKHEDLIRYSSYHFYDSSLILFPSPKGTSGEFGIAHHYVQEGYCAAGRNETEAMKVAEAVIDHFIKTPNISLGVGAMNKAQADLISDCVDRLLKDNPEAVEPMESTKLTGEAFFIKNLENIQGDERDVIIVSCTYGPDRETKNVYQRFGPINSAHGGRRLNVLASRAKKKMIVFSSLKASDIRVAETSLRGVKMFKEFLDYCESGRISDSGRETDRGPGSEFEISVGAVLRDLGYESVSNLGVAGFFIDLAVRNPERTGEYLLGIECDGATYHSAKSARDRDRLRQEILEALGWKIHRIWSTDWIRNRAYEIERLRRILIQANQ